MVIFKRAMATALTASGQYRNSGSIYMALLAGGVLEASKVFSQTAGRNQGGIDNNLVCLRLNIPECHSAVYGSVKALMIKAAKQAACRAQDISAIHSSADISATRLHLRECPLPDSCTAAKRLLVSTRTSNDGGSNKFLETSAI